MEERPGYLIVHELVHEGQVFLANICMRLSLMSLASMLSKPTSSADAITFLNRTLIAALLVNIPDMLMEMILADKRFCTLRAYEALI